jgi:hypothetical protein
LKHWVDKSWKDVVDLGEKKWEEAIIAIAKDGEEGHEVVEVISWAELKRIWIRWEEREHIGQRAGNIEKFLNLEDVSFIQKKTRNTYQSNSMDFHALM